LLGADWDGHLAASDLSSDGGDGSPTQGDGGAEVDANAIDGASSNDGGTKVDGASDASSLLRIHALSLGLLHSCILDDQGRVHCWGDNTSAQTGQPIGGFAQTSHIVTTPEATKAVALGTYHSCALGVSGAIYCWGGNLSGELGRTPAGNSTVDDNAGAVLGLTEAAVDIAARSDSTCAVLASGKIACWGDDFFGHGNDRPVLVPGLSSGALSVAVGTAFGCTIVTGGNVMCWGQNDKRQLGTDTPAKSVAPIAVALPAPAIAIAAGNSHACAVLANGKVMCWGNYADNELGPLGGGVPYAAPLEVPGITKPRAIACGEQHTCVTTASGGVTCWGLASAGALGGTPLDGGALIDVFGLSGSSDEVGTGQHHSCARLGDASPMCWGANDRGQLGNGDYTQEGPAPRTVAGW